MERRNVASPSSATQPTYETELIELREKLEAAERLLEERIPLDAQTGTCLVSLLFLSLPLTLLLVNCFTLLTPKTERAPEEPKGYKSILPLFITTLHNTVTNVWFLLLVIARVFRFACLSLSLFTNIYRHFSVIIERY